MTENERSGKRPRTRKPADDEFQQRRSFKFYHRDGDEEGREERSFGDKPRGERRFDDNRGDRRFGDRKFGDRPRRRFDDRRDDRPRRRFDDDERPRRRFDDDKPRERRFHDDDRPRRRFDDDRPRRRFDDDDRPRRRFDDDRPRGGDRRFDDRPRRHFEDDEEPRRGRKGYVREKDPLYDRPKATGEIRLNKYLADCGICSRREADDLIKAGCVEVNGEVITTMGYKVKTEDKVVYGGQTLNREKLRYILLNKPKGYITTSDDPYERDTVMELVKNACPERVYPVGRLDKQTTILDKPLTKNDMLRISEGIELDDGPIAADNIAYDQDDDSKKSIGIELHSGRNRIVRRIFEHLGYEVTKLDRVMFAGLDKYKLPRGEWRFLTDLEVVNLKKI